MNESPLTVLVFTAIAAYVFKLWLDDYKAHRAGKPSPKPLPGATPWPRSLMWIGAVGAIILVGIETAGEYALGVSAEQTTITWFFLLAMISAGFVEEVIFRGFLYYDKKGRSVLIASIVAFSLIFALLHVQYYLEWEDGAPWHAFTFKLDAKSAWSLLILFVNSLWFYYLRFSARNTAQSLAPCFVAHVASNVAVFVVKLAQGHVAGLF